MRIIEEHKYLKVYADLCELDTELLMGWFRKRNDVCYTVENNVVNRLVLGLYPITKVSHKAPKYTDKLMDYQIESLDKSLGIQSFLNRTPMGLGKTPETVRYLCEIKAKNVLIVCPKILRCQWQYQLQEWGHFSSNIYEGQQVITPGVWIINYDKLRNEKVRLKFQRFQWDCLVLDEAHKIKNRNSAQTIAVKALPALHKVALTGTPVLRYIDDLWSILNFLDVTYSGTSYWTFVNYFCHIVKTPWGNKIAGLTWSTKKVRILNQLLDLVSVTTDKKITKGKHIELVKLSMSPEQKDLYKKERDLLLYDLPENCTIANGAVLTIRLLQTTSWPGLFIEGIAGPKFEWTLEMCKNNPTEKLVVFTMFEKTATALCNYLKENGVEAYTITGQNSSAINEVNKRHFVEKTAQVLIGTISKMGQGYDQLQTVSNIMIFIDRDWSPEIMKQAEDRLCRMGQKSLVTIYYLECVHSFDQHVGRVNIKKAEDIRRALSTKED